MHQLRGCPCPGYGIFGGPGECISYRVILALDMVSLVALESASATGLSLPSIWHLWWPWRVHQLQGYPCPGYGIFGGPGECISYRVILALDMASLVALESASATGLSLPWIWHLWWPWTVHQLRDCPCSADVRSKFRDVGEVTLLST